MEESNITINGLRINYKTFRQGKASADKTADQLVLVLHGWGKGSAAWVEAGETLAQKGFRVIIPDLPGFGKSAEPRNPWTVNDYLKFVEIFVADLRLDNFDLIGHSFGGGLGAMFAAKNPQKVEKLILCDSAIIRKERLSLRQLIAKGIVKSGKFFLGLPFSGGIVPLAQRTIYKIAGVHDYQSASPIMKETFKNILREDLIGHAAKIETPTLIVWGRNDKSTPVEDATALNKIIAGSTVAFIEGAGHNSHKTHPQELANIIRQFLNDQSQI
jgi:pimeloyl-ACP methyl ester carboxylesterase